MARRQALFLDRDGVINKALIRNQKPFPPATLAEFELLAGVKVALNQFKKANYLLVVVTNQPDVATGKTTQVFVDELHRQLAQELPLDLIKACFHTDKDQCPCRKPKPGMILEAAKALEIDLAQSYMVGDRWRDIEAGEAAGTKTVWIKTDYDEPKPQKPTYTVTSLAEFARLIL